MCWVKLVERVSWPTAEQSIMSTGVPKRVLRISEPSLGEWQRKHTLRPACMHACSVGCVSS